MINRINRDGAKTVTLRPCKFCGFLGHTSMTCRKKPRKPLQAKHPMKKVGKVTKKWLETRDKWLEQNKAPYYFCRYCDKMMTRTQLTLDHWESRARHPELRYRLSNLVPCCAPCNEAKGSLSGDEYLRLLDERKAYGRN